MSDEREEKTETPVIDETPEPDETPVIDETPEPDETPVIDETAEPDEASELTAAETDTITMSANDSELIPIPPTAPRSGASILGHKLWIGNLDKRLTE